jgi:hypothetical protein
MLKDKRQQIIDYVKKHRAFLEHNRILLDVYEGNLRQYIEQAMRASLSHEYFEKIQSRILPINILQRYTDKVSSVYNNVPERKSESSQEAVDFYLDKFELNVSGGIANTYATLFKGFAWEPYINKNGVPALRELSFDRFLVMSESEVNPEEETIFIKLMGKRDDKEDSLKLHVYTDTEFDSFYMDGAEESADLVDNQGLNPIGVIPFVYGKRQKNKLIPTCDTDILAMSKAIPIMLSDAAGAQMFQCFSVLWALDVDLKDLKLSPNAIWDLKSDRSSDKTPQVGTIKPEADTDKIVSFVINMFVLWLETKGVRVGSIGNIDAGNAASGISKIIDEMDVNAIKEKSQEWFERDEEELFNKVLPKVTRYWAEMGVSDIVVMPENPEVEIEFPASEPLVSRAEDIANLKEELAMGVITLEMAVRKLYPKIDQEMIDKIIAARIPF